MRKHIYILGLLLIFCSCKDDWNQHYKDECGPLVVSDMTVYEYLQTLPEYSAFVNTLKNTKADSVLKSGQRYTVWAPQNEAIPAEIAALEDSLQGLAMQNHITPVDYAESSFKDNLILKAFSEKSLWMHTDGADGYVINGNAIRKTVAVCRDGIIYDIEGFMDMKPTLYEGFWDDPRYSRMREVLEIYMDSVFVKELSTEIGENFEGLPVYDSVFVQKVKVFDEAKIDKDKSYFTIFLAPNDELEQEIATYYKNVKAVTGFDPDEKDSTTLNDWLVHSFIHSGLIEEEAYPMQNRSSFFGQLWKTTYQKIVPGSKKEFSNGYLYELADLFIPNSLIKTKEMSNSIAPAYALDPTVVTVDVDESLVDVTTSLEEPSGSSMKYLMSKVILKGGATEDAPEFDYSLTWYTGNVELDSLGQKQYKKVSVTPGEYKVSVTFIKNADANQDFAVYINDIYVNKMEMSEITEIGKPVTVVLGRVEIPQATGVAPVKVTIKNLVTSWKRALAPSGVTLERTVNNY